MSLKWVGLPGAAVGVGLLAIVVQNARGRHAYIPALVGVSMLMFGLVLIRVEKALRAQHRKVHELQVQKDLLRTSLRHQEELELQLRHQALHDPLTGLPNRTLFKNRLEHAIKGIDRGGHGLGVLFLDIDDFKVVNDTMGHEAGDRLLVEVARRLERVARSSDTPTRLGGDEFALLLQGLRLPGDAVKVGERVIEVMNQPFEILDREAIVHVSVGVAVCPEQDPVASDFLWQADIALYAAKREGKNRCVQFSPSIEVEILDARLLRKGSETAFVPGQVEAV
jgi:diguanylate cyclase (GGDEF)-like protein